jgi:hypothetical protein
MLQRSWFQETVRNTGQKFKKLPKFHTELSFIEFYWAEAKRLTRARCDYTFENLQTTVPEVLDEISIRNIRKYARYCYR